MTRTKFAILNSMSSSGVYLIKMVITLFVRVIFIQKLGVEILGVQGVFTNILSVLSLAELGFGSSLALVLYKPLADKNTEDVVTLMSFFRKVYFAVGLIVLLFGLMVFPFLPFLGKGLSLGRVGLFYLLFLANSVFSYFYTYKRTLLNANQYGYISTLNDFIFWILVQGFQVLVLFGTKDYKWYLVVQILGTVMGNLNISRIVNRRFPEYVMRTPKKISKRLVTDIKQNTIGSMSAKIGQIIITSTDNLLISVFVGVSYVGVYSNYTVIIASGVQALLTQALYSVTPSIGHFVNTKGTIEQIQLYRKIVLYGFLFLIFSVPELMLMTSTFISLWVGSKLVLPMDVLFVMVLNFCVATMRVGTQSFINAKGMAWIARKRPILEASTNLILSIVLARLFHLGILGIVLGTLISSLGVGFVYEISILAKRGFDKGSRLFLRDNLTCFIELLVLALVSLWVFGYLNLRVNLISLAVGGFYSILISTLGVVLFTSRDQQSALMNTMNQIKTRLLKKD